MTVGPCDAATVVVVVGVVVAISDASPKYSTQRKIIAENEIINDAKIIHSQQDLDCNLSPPKIFKLWGMFGLSYG
jgi:hypothetical protein